MRLPGLAAIGLPTLVLAALACGEPDPNPAPAAPDGGQAADAGDGADVGPDDAGFVSFRDATFDEEAGPRIRERPAPDCHTGEQQGDVVTPTAAAGAPPAPGAVTVSAGTYVVVAITDYGGTDVVSAAARTTSVFTDAKQYYRSDVDGADPVAVTATWRMAGTALVRESTCPKAGTVRYELAPAPSGFEMLVPGSGGRTTGLRYRRVGG